eukprot:1092265_1
MSTNEYLCILNKMDPSEQSDLIQNYIDELKDYEKTIPLNVPSSSRLAILSDADRRIIDIMKGVLHDGSVQLDVAFCQLLSIIRYVQRASKASQYIGFFMWFVLGGSVQLDVAFCQLLSIIRYVQRASKASQYIGFFMWFVL